MVGSRFLGRHRADPGTPNQLSWNAEPDLRTAANLPTRDFDACPARWLTQADPLRPGKERQGIGVAGLGLPGLEAVVRPPGGGVIRVAAREVAVATVREDRPRLCASAVRTHGADDAVVRRRGPGLVEVQVQQAVRRRLACDHEWQVLRRADVQRAVDDRDGLELHVAGGDQPGWSGCGPGRTCRLGCRTCGTAA